MLAGFAVYGVTRHALIAAFDQALLSRADAILQVTEINEEGEFEFDLEDLSITGLEAGGLVIDYELRDKLGRVVFDQIPACNCH